MNKRNVLRGVFVLWCASGWIGAAQAEEFIVKDGTPNAEIVISTDDQRPRMLALAALELQYYLQEISGARLPIVTQPGDMPVKIYVGRSEHTDRLGVTDAGLKYGAFRMRSGPDSLVLLGQDADYTPQEPWARNHGDRPRAQKAWDELAEQHTGRTWGHPFKSTYKAWWNPRDYDEFMTARYGADTKHVWNPRDLGFSREYQGAGTGAGWWVSDRGGTLNAVYGFLRTLGVRWYLPRDYGDVVPTRPSLRLPSIDRTVHPEYALRNWGWYFYGAFSFEDTIWARRLGMNSGFEIFGNTGRGHGLTQVSADKAMQANHPEYYAFWRGHRVTDYRGEGHVCFSVPGFFRETLTYARFMFDQVGAPHVSLWPQDGFHKCDCTFCAKWSSSDLVWGFVDRVARELQDEYPDCLISGGAYTPYIHPPGNVEKFPPNVCVMIANSGRCYFDNPFWWDAYWERITGWADKLAPRRIVRSENNRFGMSRRFPVIHPRAVAKDLRALKGISLGDQGEQAQQYGRWVSPGYDHLTRYVQARFLWDPDQELDALLDEYYENFYGPAGEAMRKAFEFAESHYSRTDTSRPGGRGDPRNVPLEVRVRFGELLHAARQAAGDTIYGRRVQLVLDEYETRDSFAEYVKERNPDQYEAMRKANPPLEELRRRLAEQRQDGDPRSDAPVVTAYHVDRAGASATNRLGRVPRGESEIETTFNVTWDREALHFDIRCQEPDMDSLVMPEEVWEGDSVLILLETPGHSYYDIEISPAGKVFDADRVGGGQVNARWDSLADVETEQGEDYWRVRVRIPIAVIGEEGAAGDPNNYVVGPRPGPGSEWYVNLGRRRVRGEKQTWTGVHRHREREMVKYTFAPTGTWSFFDARGAGGPAETFAKLRME